MECDVHGALNAGWDAIHFDPWRTAAPSTTRSIHSLRTLLELDLNQR
jgi:FMN phosphatase YigB (HAD superfamily)